MLGISETKGAKQTYLNQEVNIISVNFFDLIYNNKSSNYATYSFAKIREVYNVNINWLLTEEGVMFSPDSDGRFFNPGESDKEELEEISGNKAVYQYKTSGLESRTIALPLLGQISAGAPFEIVNPDFWKYIEIPNAFLWDKYDNYFVFMVNGQSMEPTIFHGDIVVIHKRDDWFNLTGKVIAIRTADGITLKKVQYDEKRRQIFLLPFNMNFDIIVLSEEELINVNIIGEMAMQFRIFK